MNKKFLIVAIALLFICSSFITRAMEEKPNVVSKKIDCDTNLPDYDALNYIISLAQNSDLNRVTLETLLLQGLEFSRLRAAVAGASSNDRALIMSVLVEYGATLEEQELDDFQINDVFLRAFALHREEKIIELAVEAWATLDVERQIQLFRMASGYGFQATVKLLLRLFMQDFEKKGLSIVDLYKALREGLEYAVIVGDLATVNALIEHIYTINREIRSANEALSYAVEWRTDSLFQNALRFAVLQGHVDIVNCILTNSLNPLPGRYIKLETENLRSSLESSMLAVAHESDSMHFSLRFSDTLKARYYQIIERLSSFKNEKAIYHLQFLPKGDFVGQCIIS